MSAPNLKEIAKKIGYEFADTELLVRALTHASVTNHDRQLTDYEQFEFLGDRVLGLVIADYLRQTYPEERVGQWAKRLAVLTSREACAQVTRLTSLETAINFDPKSRSQSLSENILADICESVIAAIYLDGGYEGAREFILNAWAEIFDKEKIISIPVKSELQELCLAAGLGLPSYTKIAQTGPAHAPEIVVQVSLKDGRQEQGSAGSKKLAETKAAEKLLNILKGADDE